MIDPLVNTIRNRVAQQLADRTHDDEELGRPPTELRQKQEYARRLIAQAIDHHTSEALINGREPLDSVSERRIAQKVYDALFGLAGFQPLLEDPEIENINVNGHDNVHVRYADGRRERVGKVAGSDDELVELIRTAAARLGVGERRFDLGSPMLSMQLPDGSRLFATMAVSRRPCVAIRRHRYMRITLKDLIKLGTADKTTAEFLRKAVQKRKNILVCGGTGIGKTTLLRALAAEIPPEERLITVEDAYELGLDLDPDAHPDVMALQTREPNVEGEGEITLERLVRAALRASPDRLIVGEVRGPEVVIMLNAMSQGNDGSMCTLHASSSRGAFSKLAAYAVQAQERMPMEATAILIANAIHFVVHLTYSRNTRVISSIREVVDADGVHVVSNEIFRPGPDRRAVPGVPLRTETAEDLGWSP